MIGGCSEYSSGKLFFRFRDPPCNSWLLTCRYANPFPCNPWLLTCRYANPFILKSMRHTVFKNKGVLTRGWFPSLQCGHKKASIYWSNFGFKLEDLPYQISQNGLYIFSRPQFDLKPVGICFLFR